MTNGLKTMIKFKKISVNANSLLKIMSRLIAIVVNKT